MSHFVYSYAIAQTIGTRDTQEDCALCSAVEAEGVPASKVLAIVADGMGGYSKGEVASREVATAFKSSYEENPDESLVRHVRVANAALATRKGAEEMDAETGTTLVAAQFADNKCTWVSVGDSLLLFQRRGENMRRLNTSQIFAKHLDAAARRGEISEKIALTHPLRSALYAAICGTDKDLREIEQELDGESLNEGDRIVLATDGLLTLEHRLESLMSRKDIQMSSAKKVAQFLCDEVMYEFERAQAKELRKAQDNTTVIVVDVLNRENKPSAPELLEDEPELKTIPTVRMYPPTGKDSAAAPSIEITQEPDDTHTQGGAVSKQSLHILLLILVILVVGIAAWYLSSL